jgi:hypothetical protein
MRAVPAESEAGGETNPFGPAGDDDGFAVQIVELH